jgi:hypothetical protein
LLPGSLPCSLHGNALKWLIWVEDSDNEHIYHSGARGGWIDLR